jgi:hypothetical protein
LSTSCNSSTASQFAEKAADRELVFTNQIRVRRQFIKRHVGFLSDMCASAGELVSIPHVENKQGGIPFKACRERNWLNPRPDKSTR